MLGVDLDAEIGAYNQVNSKLEKLNKDLAYEVHHKKQLLTKLLAHIIADDTIARCRDEDDVDKEKIVNEVSDEFIKYLNHNYAKVHFTQAEIEYIKDIIEESKKFI